MSERLGQQLGNYKLVRLLGHGGFANVYLGEHIHLQTQAAIKVLHTSLEGVGADQFLQEARTLARLKHSHIVRILDFDVDQHVPFLVMDYFPHGNLRRSYSRGQVLPPELIRSFVAQIASALDYAHDQHVIHRDIKPENMLLDEQNRVSLSDFGIAVLVQSSNPSTQGVAGTATYMAPEQIQGKARKASDQYALGIVVYEWLCGAPPFQGSFTEIASQHLFQPPPSLRERVPAVPAPVEKALLIALAKEPERRFATVGAFAAALEHAYQATSVPVSSSPSYDVLHPIQPASQSSLTGAVPVQSPVGQSEAPAGIDIARQAQQDVLPVPTPLLTPTLPAQDMPSTERRFTDQPRGVKRRVLVAGLGLAALAAASGGILWFSTRQQQLVRTNSSSTSHSSHASEHGVTQAPARTPTQTPTSTHPSTVPIGTLLFTYPGTSAVWSLSWSPDDKRIVSGYQDSTIHLWNVADGGDLSLYQEHTASVTRVTWSPGGQAIASTSDDGTFRIWNALSRRDLYTFATGVHGHALAWSPNGKLLATGGDTATVQIWDTSTWTNLYTYKGHTGAVWWVAWSPNGQRVASASNDGTVQVWDATSGGHAYTYTGHGNIVWAVAWSPDGNYLASAGWDQTVQVWRASDGTRLYTYQGHSDVVRDVEWSPNSLRLASAGYDTDHTVQIWDALDGGNRYVYSGHSGGLSAVEWSYDGTRIASGGADMTVQIWQAV
ncbi:MAG TPA: serine/threonine-protein kinase [Ktedonobacteraceae bacterium]|nr:serine/threonine-protein kinase [Ktedonobacteraceae bacterium]